MTELTNEELMKCDGGTPLGDVMVAGGSTLIGFAIGGPVGALVGFGISVIGVLSNC